MALALPKNRDRCPKCGSKDFLRSRRKNFIEFGVSKFVLPYRCPHCYLRFFRPVQVAEAEDPNRYRLQYSGLQQPRRT
jgi:C4-type Zn-finger protein